MAEVHVNGVDLTYQQIGEGPDLVLVHGLAASRAFWYPHYAAPLSRHFRITMFDLRGHGYSSRPEHGYDAATMAQDLAGLLDHLGIERCALVGHSYGAAVALEFAGRQPGRVTRLVILDTKVNRLQAQQRLSDSPHLTRFEIETAKRSGEDWEQETQVGLRFLEVLARWRLEGGEFAERDPYTPFGEGRGALRAAKQWLDLLDRTAARKEFLQPGLEEETIAALPMPVLLVYGEYSRCLPSCFALQRLLPRAEVEIVPRSGHFFPVSHGTEVVRRLSQFLGIVLQAGGEPFPSRTAASP